MFASSEVYMEDILRGFGKFVKVKQGPHENDYHDATILLVEKITSCYQLGTIKPDQWKTICRMLYCPETRGELVKTMKETAQIYNDAVKNNKVTMETQIFVERQLRVYKDFLVSMCKHAKENGVVAEYEKENKLASTKIEDLKYYKYIVHDKTIEDALDAQQL